MPQRVRKFLFFAYILLNLNNSINIVHRLLKCPMVILDIIMEGNMSQIFYLGPSSHFILCDLENNFSKFYKMLPHFDIK